MKPIDWVACAFFIWTIPAEAGVFPHYDVGAGGDQDDRSTLSATVDVIRVDNVMGDGNPDVIVSFRGDSVLVPSVVVGQGNGTRELSPAQALSSNPFRFFLNPDEILLGTIDLNKDGYSDLVFYGSSVVRVVRGRSVWTNPSTRLDADWTIPISPPPLSALLTAMTMIAADFNGDHRDDMVLTWLSNYGVGETLVVFGKETLPPTIDPTLSANAQRWQAGDREIGTITCDVNQDGRDDLLFGSQGKLTIVYGSTTPRMGWDWAGSSDILKVSSGQSGVSLSPKFVTDQNEDGVADVVFYQSGTPATWVWVDGLSLNVGTGTVALSSLTTQLVLQTGNNQALVMFSDLDGDAKEDAVALTNGADSTFSIYGAGALDVFPLSQSRFDIQTVGDEFFSGVNSFSADWDRDGIKDIFIWSSSFLNPIVASLNTFYGFAPLENPSLTLLKQQPGAKRALVELSVQGEPAEMKLTGDLDEATAGTWIPFQSQRTLQLTSTPGAKSVTAVYRTRHGRESAPVSLALSVPAEGPSLRAVTNRMSGTDSQVELDCRVQQGPMQAAVFERNGRKVRQLPSLDGQGLLTVRWDGRNDSGERVRPGVYVVVVDFDGRQEKANVLVE